MLNFKNQTITLQQFPQKINNVFNNFTFIYCLYLELLFVA